MIQHLQRFAMKLIPFSLTVFALHFVLQYFNVWPLSSGYFYGIHLFNLTGSASLFVALAYCFENLKDKAGFIYLALSILKMLLVMILMAVVILGKKDSSMSFALQFMGVYGLYLSYEVVSMVKKLNS
jgi:hypothetical protein